MNAETEVIIRLDENGRVYWPGEELAGEYWLDAPTEEQCKAVEVSVLWYTEGKGDEDMAIHAFWRYDADERPELDPRRPERFHTILPNSPLSYTGAIIGIRWCVRVRAFLQRGREVTGQKAFQLGDLPALPHGAQGK